jgi:hypothetical protein
MLPFKQCASQKASKGGTITGLSLCSSMEATLKGRTLIRREVLLWRNKFSPDSV